MKTVAQLGSGKVPVGTTAYMGRAAHLLQCRSGVQKGEFSSLNVFFFVLLQLQTNDLVSI